MTSRISFPMIPAVETQLAESRIEDIGSVPATEVELTNGRITIVCLGLIDTGSDVSVLDETVFQKFDEDLPTISERVRVGGFSALGIESSIRKMDIYQCMVQILGESRKQGMKFENVPITVARLHRPLFVIGRRGILDRLKVQLDFPRKRVVLTRPGRLRSSKYPFISREFSSFRSIMKDIEDDKLIRTILQIGWEMEQFLDRLIIEDKVLHEFQENRLSRPRTLSDKFRMIEKHEGLQDITEPVRTLIDARNRAAHGVPFEAPDRASVEALMVAAEKIVSRLRSRRFVS